MKIFIDRLYLGIKYEREGTSCLSEYVKIPEKIQNSIKQESD